MKQKIANDILIDYDLLFDEDYMSNIGLIRKRIKTNVCSNDSRFEVEYII